VKSSLIITITKKDLIRQTFRAGGKGGQNQNKVETGVRFVHEPSGARGEARDSRSQSQNERAAFERLVESKTFQSWLHVECARRMNKAVIPSAAEIKQKVDKMVDAGFKNGEILVEYYA